jgi:hypothetical protein
MKFLLSRINYVFDSSLFPAYFCLVQLTNAYSEFKTHFKYHPYNKDLFHVSK